MWLVLLLCFLSTSCQIEGLLDEDETLVSKPTKFGIRGNALSPISHEEQQNFSFIWNVPSNLCHQFGINLNITSYGIRANEEEISNGSTIVIFYTDQIGLLPHIEKNGKWINGGIPQKCNFSLHLAKAKYDIARTIPDPDFSGLVIIDWESWNPVWEMNTYKLGARYQKYSIDFVRQQHPNWPADLIVEEAKRQFEEAGRQIMLQTLLLGRSLRPHGQWGYYYYPLCDNKLGEGCSRRAELFNGELLWLFEASTALYPSSYLKIASESESEKINIEKAHACEARRIGDIVKQITRKSLPIYVYNRFRYENDCYLSEKDLHLALSIPKKLGFDGTVLWDFNGVTKTRSVCMQLNNYVRNILGPTVQKVHSDTSKETC